MPLFTKNIPLHWNSGKNMVHLDITTGLASLTPNAIGSFIT